MLLGKQYLQSAPTMMSSKHLGVPGVTGVQNNGRSVWTHMLLGA